MNDNPERIPEAIEHPERFSDEQLASLLSDPDTREIYNLMSKTADALTETPPYDIDSEWRRFAANHLRTEAAPSFLSRVWSNHAAAAVAFGIIASLAVAAVTVGIRQATRQDETDRQETVAVHAPVNIATETYAATDSTISTGNVTETATTFRNEPFEMIVTEICRHYGAKVKFENQDVKALHLYYRWDRTLPLPDIVEELNNFEQISITLSDNLLTVE